VREMLGRFRRGVGRMEFLSLGSVLVGAMAVKEAADHQANWAWAVGTIALSLAPGWHVLAAWMRKREHRDGILERIAELERKERERQAHRVGTEG
jgi:hypothetical protein